GAKYSKKGSPSVKRITFINGAHAAADREHHDRSQAIEPWEVLLVFLPISVEPSKCRPMSSIAAWNVMHAGASNGPPCSRIFATTPCETIRKLHEICRRGPIAGCGSSKPCKILAMTHPAKRYMDRQRIVRTHDIDAAQAFLHGKGFEL